MNSRVRSIVCRARAQICSSPVSVIHLQQRSLNDAFHLNFDRIALLFRCSTLIYTNPLRNDDDKHVRLSSNLVPLRPPSDDESIVARCNARSDWRLEHLGARSWRTPQRVLMVQTLRRDFELMSEFVGFLPECNSYIARDSALWLYRSLGVRSVPIMSLGNERNT